MTHHYDDVIMGKIASQITSLTIVYSAVYLGADQSKHQSSASLAFVWGIHRGPVNSPHKWPVTRKMFPFDDVIMDDAMALKRCLAVTGGSSSQRASVAEFWFSSNCKNIRFTPWRPCGATAMVNGTAVLPILYKILLCVVCLDLCYNETV